MPVTEQTNQQNDEQNQRLAFFDGGGLGEGRLSSFVAVALALPAALPATVVWDVLGFEVVDVVDWAVTGFEVEDVAAGCLEVDEVAAGDGLELEGVVAGVGFSTLVCSANFEAALIAAGPLPSHTHGSLMATNSKYCTTNTFSTLL